MFYRYCPGFLDLTNPRIIAGQAIEPDSKVTITKTRLDPCNLFVFIEDLQGNRQSVYRKSLISEREFLRIQSLVN